jgi:hypothetical protein
MSGNEIVKVVVEEFDKEGNLVKRTTTTRTEQDKTPYTGTYYNPGGIVSYPPNGATIWNTKLRE